MVQWVIALSDLPEDPNLVPMPIQHGSQPPVIPSPEDLTILKALALTCIQLFLCTHIHIQIHIHMHNLK